MADPPSSTFDVFACANTSHINCEYAAKVVAAIADNRTADYLAIFRFYKRSLCLKAGTNLSEVIDEYEHWTRDNQNGNHSPLYQLLNDVCRIDFCKNLVFPGNPDFAGIGVSINCLYSSCDAS